MAVSNQAFSPANVAARRIPRQVVTWIVVDGQIQQSQRGQQVDIVLVVVAHTPSGYWQKTLHRSAPSSHHQAMFAELSMRLDATIASIIRVHGPTAVFVSPTLGSAAIDTLTPLAAPFPLSMELRARAARIAGQAAEASIGDKESGNLAALAYAAPQQVCDKVAQATKLVAPPIRIATDASRNRVTGKVSIAWVGDHGQHDSEFIQRGMDINIAEYQALCRGIVHAFSNYPQRQIYVYCDSKIAILLLQQHGVGVESVDALLSTSQCQVVWVPAHRGHPLNEAAHRLAVYTRRSVEWNIPSRYRKRVEKNILTDLWSSLNSPEELWL